MKHQPLIEVRDYMLRPRGVYSLYDLNTIGIYLEDIVWGEGGNHGLRLYPTDEFYLWIDEVEQSYNYTVRPDCGATDEQISIDMGLSAGHVNKLRRQAVEKLKDAIRHNKDRAA